MKELWKNVPEYEGLYQISSLGQVRSLKKNKLLKPETTHFGHKRVRLYKDGVTKKIYVHQLVARAFIPNPNLFPYVNHMDQNPANNHADNLEWCTQKHNLNYGTRNQRLRQSIDAPHVRQLTPDGYFVAEYQSVLVAAELLGYDYSNIYKCCRGEKQTMYGYKWELV